MNRAETYRGTVLSLSGPGLALVRLDSVPSSAGCNACALSIVCGSKTQDDCHTQVLARIPEHFTLQNGDEVTLQLIPGSRALAASSMLGLPLCAMGAAGTLCGVAHQQDWVVALAALGAGALALAFVSYASRRSSKTRWTVVS